jgi:hypothetical protein
VREGARLRIAPPLVLSCPVVASGLSVHDSDRCHTLRVWKSTQYRLPTTSSPCVHVYFLSRTRLPLCFRLSTVEWMSTTQSFANFTYYQNQNALSPRQPYPQAVPVRMPLVKLQARSCSPHCLYTLRLIPYSPSTTLRTHHRTPELVSQISPTTQPSSLPWSLYLISYIPYASWSNMSSHKNTRSTGVPARAVSTNVKVSQDKAMPVDKNNTSKVRSSAKFGSASCAAAERKPI